MGLLVRVVSNQLLARLKGGEEVGREDVYEISGVIPDRCGLHLVHGVEGHLGPASTWHLAPGNRYIEGLLEVCQLNSYDRLQVWWEMAVVNQTV